MDGQVLLKKQDFSVVGKEERRALEEDRKAWVGMEGSRVPSLPDVGV